MVTIGQLAEIPYLDASALGVRFIPTLCFYDSEWHLWTEAGEGREMLIYLRIVEAAETLYFAKAPASEKDFFWPFLDFLAQQASSPSIGKAFSAIRDDIMNLGASLAKIELLAASKDRVPHGLSRMVATEIEYIVLICRGLFDFLQEFLAGTWKTIFLLDQSSQQRDLKKSFREMLMFGGERADSASLQNRFGLPENVADCYIRASDVFFSIRKFRDNIIHQGSPLPTMFETSDGFKISAKFAPMPDLNIWHDYERDTNYLVLLLPALQAIVSQTLNVCDDFSTELKGVIKFPDPIAPDMSLYIRSYFSEHLVEAIRSASERP